MNGHSISKDAEDAYEMQNASRKGISVCDVARTSLAYKMHFQTHTLQPRKSCIPKSLSLFAVFSRITLSLGIYVTIFKIESKWNFKERTKTS